MPIYEYRCQKCSHELDVIQKVSEAPLTDCPECGEAALRKLVSAPSFRLKGSGWYETDFKKDNRRNLADGGDKPAESTSKDDKSAGKEKAGGDKTVKKDSASTSGRTTEKKSSSG